MDIFMYTFHIFTQTVNIYRMRIYTNTSHVHRIEKTKHQLERNVCRQHLSQVPKFYYKWICWFNICTRFIWNWRKKAKKTHTNWINVSRNRKMKIYDCIVFVLASLWLFIFLLFYEINIHYFDSIQTSHTFCFFTYASVSLTFFFFFFFKLEKLLK